MKKGLVFGLIFLGVLMLVGSVSADELINFNTDNIVMYSCHDILDIGDIEDYSLISMKCFKCDFSMDVKIYSDHSFPYASLPCNETNEIAYLYLNLRDVNLYKEGANFDTHLLLFSDEENKNYQGMVGGNYNYNQSNEYPLKGYIDGYLAGEDGNQMFINTEYFLVQFNEDESIHSIQLEFRGYKDSQLIKQNEERISALETWKDTITNTIADIVASITGLVTKTNNIETALDDHQSSIDEHRDRITALESLKDTITITIETIWVRLFGEDPGSGGGGGTTPVCGNGILETGEECDDGNLVNGDGCDTNCDIEVVIGDNVKFRTTDLDYGRGAIAFTDTCGDYLTKYGKGTPSSTSIYTCDTYYRLGNKLISNLPASESINGDGDGVIDLYEYNSGTSTYPNYVAICEDDVDGKGLTYIKYYVGDNDAYKVSNSKTSSDSNYEVSC